MYDDTLLYIYDTIEHSYKNYYEIVKISKICKLTNQYYKKFKLIKFNNILSYKFYNDKIIYINYCINKIENKYKLKHREHNIMINIKKSIFEFQSDNTIKYMYIIYDLLELAILSKEKKYNQILKKINRIKKNYDNINMLKESAIDILKYIINITSTTEILFEGYGIIKITLMKYSIYTLIFILIDKTNIEEFNILQEINLIKKKELIDHLNLNNYVFPYYFCKNLIKLNEL
tara:strand:+ start:558 stop:1253 length:696 start_codon:yes stop_codon:yes gene_type:complete